MTRYSLLFSAFTVCLSQVLPSQLRSVPGDNFCSDLMCVTAFVNASTVTCKCGFITPNSVDRVNELNIPDQMSALNQLGWMAMHVLIFITSLRVC